MKHEYRSVPIDLIDVPEDRIRPVKADRVQILLADIRANGLLHSIGLVEEMNGRHTLVFGAHRLSAVDLMGASEIDARVVGRQWVKPQELRIWEIMENLNHEGLTALERAESLAALKVLHEELYPETRKGGDRGNQHRGGKKRQSEFFRLATMPPSASAFPGALSRLPWP
jgi:ParB family chromosome partitioning protein